MGWFTCLAGRLIARASRRAPNFVVGGREHPYLMRWWIIPRNPIFNIYLHRFVRDDDDRALHDHPWPWCSILLRGRYIEHTIGQGGIHHHRERTAGSVRIASPWHAHRIELTSAPDGAIDGRLPCWTLFVTGPRMRRWGFHCPERGWVYWKEFVATDDPGSIGIGCGEP